MARGVFVEPFYGGSHRAFLDGLVANSKHKLDLLTLPGERWRQRMRLGAQVLARGAIEWETEPDFLAATDMLDLPAFLALTRPRFSHTPVLLYMHENQFTYPRIRGTRLNSWFGQINYLSTLAADRVVFNSAYHRSDYLAALRELSRTPTNWLDDTAVEAIEAKSGVLAPGLDLQWLDAHAPSERRSGPPRILWNHRWEFDKAPAMFVRAVERLADEGLAFEVAVAGEPGDNPDPAMERLRDGLGGRVTHFGHCEARDDYARLLWQADVTVSTARHEFFGISTVEAMYCGCVPVAPKRLNYPSLVPGSLHEACLFEDETGLTELLRARLTTPLPSAVPVLRRAARQYDWSVAAARWDAEIETLIGQR